MRGSGQGKWAWTALLALFALTLCAGFGTVLGRVLCPLQVQQTEAYMADRALLFFTGESLYPDPSLGGPYILTAYPPFYFFLQACLQKLTGGLWMAGRLLSLGGYLACGLMIFFAGREKWGWREAALGAMVFWSSPTWALWGSIVRPDALALALQFAAFLLLDGGVKDERAGGGPFRPFLAGLLAAAAVSVKQTSLSLLAAMVLASWLGRRRRDLPPFLAGALPPLLALVLWEEARTKGMFLRHTFLWLDTGFDPGTLRYFLLHPFLREAGWLVLGLALTLAFRKIGTLLRCQILAASLQLAFLGRNGGAENYWMEFWLYGTLVLAEGGWLAGEGRAKWMPFALGLAAYLSLALCPWPSFPGPEEVRMKREAVRMVPAQGPVLLLDLDLALMAGKRVWYQPVEFQYLFRNGRWDGKPLMEDLRAAKFSMVEVYDLPEQYLLPREFLGLVEGPYRLASRAYGRRWYLPR